MDFPGFFRPLLHFPSNQAGFVVPWSCFVSSQTGLRFQPGKIPSAEASKQSQEKLPELWTLLFLNSKLLHLKLFFLWDNLSNLSFAPKSMTKSRTVLALWQMGQQEVGAAFGSSKVTFIFQFIIYYLFSADSDLSAIKPPFPAGFNTRWLSFYYQ